MNRITVFWEKRKKALVPFITAGFPKKNFTPEAVLALADSGADMVEIGIPFSDPMADGPTIQASSQIALRNGLQLKNVFGHVEKIRMRTEVPLLLMGYYNPFLVYGLEKFASDAARCGVDGLIVPDLTPEEGGELLHACRRTGLSLVYLIAPTTPPNRISQIDAACLDFAYCVSMIGVTGARKKNDAELKDYLLSVRAKTQKPFVAGFGISTPEDAGRVARYSDGVVVGSALVRFFLEEKKSSVALKRASNLVKQMAGRLNGIG